MLLQGQVGPLAISQSLAPGSTPPIRQGQLGDAIFSELHGRYYEANYRRALFGAANTAGVATPACTSGTTTAYTGLILSNPVGSQVNLSIMKCAFSFPVAPAAALAVGLALSYNSGTNVTHTTPVTPRSLFYGVGPTPVGLVDSSATLPTAPVFMKLLGTVAAAIFVGEAVQDMEGGIILPPGAYAAFFTTTASGAAGFLGSYTWEEIPL
jgi:hypothetical protein